MKICLVTSSFPANAADLIQAPFILDVIRELGNRGHSVVVYTQEKPGATEGWDGIRVERFKWSAFSERTSELAAHPFQNLGLILRLILKGTWGLNRLQSREKFDAVLCCWTVPAGLLARFAVLLGRMPPYAVWALGSDINGLKNRTLGHMVLRWVLRGAGVRFADGLALAEDVRRISGCDCEFLPTFRSLGSDVETRTAKSETRCILFVGRHDEVKGIEILIEALILLRKKRPDLLFTANIVGEGPLTDKLRTRVVTEGMASHIQFPGKVKTTALAGLYQVADCVVIPSLSESIPLVLGEAIQCHRPLVVTDVGDMGHLVKQYGLGLVIARPEVPLVMEALESFLSHPIEPANARWEEALEILSLDKNMPKLIRGLERMVGTTCA
jgi:glycosyltransferase involved in cell wall biosynthesis